ncbi:MAG: hypothetical protein GKR89_24780 [Candidatus Latescibacteria bacterium]|nr:hypothetical protein [Candidatus Latescibacterota bacterium]
MDRANVVFNWAKIGDLIPPPPQMPAPGPYYTTLVSMREVEGFPFDYALYFSTDHHPGEGGIWLYLCDGVPSQAANWLSYDEAVARGAFDHLPQKPAANPIFVDAVQGDGHTETPHAHIVDGTVYMSYHKNGIDSSQATLLATSADGVNFARINGPADSVILRYDPTVDPGDGHTGYFRWGVNPFAGIAQQYVGYSLHGGGDDYHSAIWASDNAVQWQRLDILTPVEGLAVDREDWMIIWHEIDPGSIRRLDDGDYAVICGVGNRASGDVARIVELYEIYLAADGKTLTRPSRKILGRGQAGASDAEELGSASIVATGPDYHLVYVGASGQGGVNTIMGAVGQPDTASPR